MRTNFLIGKLGTATRPWWVRQGRNLESRPGKRKMSREPNSSEGDSWRLRRLYKYLWSTWRNANPLYLPGTNVNCVHSSENHMTKVTISCPYNHREWMFNQLCNLQCDLNRFRIGYLKRSIDACFDSCTIWIYVTHSICIKLRYFECRSLC